MSWFTRFTRFGSAHLVYSQEKPNSCGPSSVMMTLFKLNKLTLKQAVYSEQEIYDVYNSVEKQDGESAVYDGSEYSYATTLARVLNRIGTAGTWHAKSYDASKVTGRVVQSLNKGWPIIMLANWVTQDVNGVWKVVGGHFVVVDQTYNWFGDRYASICDPWDGNVHITKFKVGEQLTYVGDKVPWSWSIGGKKNDYTTRSLGVIRWLVRRKS